MKTEHNGKIRIPILVPFGVTIAMLMIASTISIYWLQKRHLSQNVREIVRGTQILFQEQLSKDAMMMNGLIDFLKKDKNIQRAWLAKDRQALLDYAMPLFKDIRSKYRVTHFYLHGTDRICFLRVHNPPKYGDYIKRFTMSEVVQQAKPVYGIELGNFGTFTLRVIHPWYIDDKLVGYLELGEEIEHITPSLKKILGTELCLIVNKSYLDRAGWEEGLKVFGKSGNWDLIPDYVVIDSTIGKIPPELPQHLTSFHNEHKDLLFKTKIADRRYKGGFSSLIDAGKREVGDIVVMKDVTESKASGRKLMTTLIIACSLIGTALLVSLNFYIGLIEKKLTTAYSNLQNEVKHRKEIEKELQRTNNEMEIRVKERTAELSNEITERRKTEGILKNVNETLEGTIYKLTVANRELRDFAHIAAHDLKAPLRAIGGLAGMISNDCRDKLDEQSRELFDMLIARAERMNELITGILRYSELGRVIDVKQEVDMNEAVQEAITEVAPPENIEIIKENDFPVIMCDKTHMIQVFQNLLSNAVKYMDKPQGCIRLGCMQNNDFWQFSVADNGPGIEEKYFEKIFQIFQTLTRRDEIEGTGIGLSLVRKIAEIYDGQAWVESQPGRGSTFLFTLSKQKVGIQNEKLQANTVS